MVMVMFNVIFNIVLSSVWVK